MCWLYAGKELGSGAFGRVVKATATGLKLDEPVTTVAVKMVRSQLDTISNSAAEALISELKILIYLGSHVNVVNLLGACTERIPRNGELFVIVEYCRFGNLCTFLRQQRSNFINLVDPVTGALMPPDYHLLIPPNR